MKEQVKRIFDATDKLGMAFDASQPLSDEELSGVAAGSGFGDFLRGMWHDVNESIKHSRPF